MWTGVLALAGGLVFSGYHSNFFRKTGDRLAAEMLAASAEAGFKVKDILVTGRTHIPAEELLARLSIKENMPIFGVDIAEAQKSLASISWVKDVSISRRLPDKIIVELKERAPVALWQYQKKISVIDKEGVILTTEALDAYRQLPLVVGSDASKHVAELVGLLNTETEIAAALVSAVRIGGRRWDLQLKNDISVKLPERDVELALRRLAAAEEQQNIFNRRIVSIDLRQPEKLMITPAVIEAPAKENKKTNI